MSEITIKTSEIKEWTTKMSEAKEWVIKTTQDPREFLREDANILWMFELTRCKDCKHEHDFTQCYMRHDMWKDIGYDDFCSQAYRKNSDK